MGYRVLGADEGWSMRARAGKPAQNNRISRFTKMVSAIESAIDQTRQPGMKRTWVRSPDRFQIAIIYGVASTSSGRQSATQCPNDVIDGKCEEDATDHRTYLLVRQRGPLGHRSGDAPGDLLPPANKSRLSKLSGVHRPHFRSIALGSETLPIPRRPAAGRRGREYALRLLSRLVSGLAHRLDAARHAAHALPEPIGTLCAIGNGPGDLSSIEILELLTSWHRHPEYLATARARVVERRGSSQCGNRGTTRDQRRLRPLDEADHTLASTLST